MIAYLCTMYSIFIGVFIFGCKIFDKKNIKFRRQPSNAHIILLLTILTGGAALLTAYYGTKSAEETFGQKRYRIEELNWSTVEGTIISSEIYSIKASRGSAIWVPTWRFAYVRNGKSYVSGNEDLTGGYRNPGYPSEYIASQAIKARAVGSKVIVWVDPLHPENAVLDRISDLKNAPPGLGLSIFLFAFSMIMVFLFSGVLNYVIYFLKMSKKSRKTIFHANKIIAVDKIILLRHQAVRRNQNKKVITKKFLYRIKTSFLNTIPEVRKIFLFLHYRFLFLNNVRA